MLPSPDWVKQYSECARAEQDLNTDFTDFHWMTNPCSSVKSVSIVGASPPSPASH